jgi:signal transduction histidine kinase
LQPDSPQVFRHPGERTYDYHKKVVKFYLGLRLFFVATSLAALLLLSQDILKLDGVGDGALVPLWKAFVVFAGWSLVLIGIAYLVRQREAPGLIDKLILISLIPDSYTIYSSAVVTGATASPLYHSVYLLIAIHSYHLAAPNEKKGEQDRANLISRYLLFGVGPSVLFSMVVFSSLVGAKPSTLQFWIQLVLQFVTAMSFAWLGLTDSERFYALARKEEELENNRVQLQANSRNLDQTSAQLETATRNLQKAKSDQERMLQALGRVTNIAEMKDEKSLASGLNGLAEQIGRTLEVEYCAVGLANETTVEDVAIWTSFVRSERMDELLEGSRVNPIENSLIGSVLYARRRPLLWDQAVDGDPLTPTNPRAIEEGLRINAAAAASYRDILPGGEARNMLLIPFYSPHETKRAVGYLHLINRQPISSQPREAGFTEAHAESLQAIADQLAIAIENFRSHQRDLQEREDDTFIARLGTVVNTDAFDDILAFLNDKLESRVASLWLPIEDGFGSPEETRKLVLRSVRVSGQEIQSGANWDLEERLRQRGLQLHSETYVGNYLDGSQQEPIHYQPNLSGHVNCWSDLFEEIGSPRLLLLTIYDPLAAHDDATSPADNVLAVLCLRPRREDFQLTPAISDRLRRFGHLIEGLILEKRLKRRFEQIRFLQEGLKRLQVDDLREFYSRLVHLVQGVMGAEACSLFLRERAPTVLMLKASTAERARIRNPQGIEEEVEVLGYIDQPIFTTADQSLTVEIFLRKQPVLVYDTYSNFMMSRKFLEVTATSTPRSFLGAPLVTGQDEVLGVLRCINQQESHRLLPGFLHSERQFFALLAGVITRFIEGAQWGGAKRKFLREMAHEFTTPLLQAQTNTSFIDRYLRGSQKTKDPLEIIANLRDTLSHLQSMVKDIQFQLERSKTEEQTYNMKTPVDLHALVEQIRKPMIPVARQSRALEVFGKTSGAPSLYIDRARFGQVLYNLLQNAVKYSRYGGADIYIEYDLHEERIAGRNEKRWHRIRVKNEGIGVPQGEEKLIFQEHVRGSNTQFVATGQSGTGLGLSVSRRIVERHGGLLRLERRDSPTIFAVLLPLSLEKGGS